MQKLDFVQHLKTVVDKLDSERITDHFDSGLNLRSTIKQEIVEYNFAKITPLLFSSKVNYENLLLQDNYASFLKEVGADKIYNEDNLARLARVLTTEQYYMAFKSPEILQLYQFHQGLIKMLEVAESLLLNELTDKDFLSSLESGVLLFQVVIDNDYISSEEYIRILDALQELVNVTGKILIDKEDNYQTDIILLDSGSDTNIGIQTFAEVAKSIFFLFKEIWDYITNHGIYQNEKKNKALLDSLAIRKEIQKNVKEGVLSEAEGKEYTHLVKTRVDKLIGMKVLPKQIVTGSYTQTQTNRNLLDELNIKGFLTSEQDKGEDME
ncbi:hypothetical protein D0T84_08820 [Dysgonomonas sp. 521]|uniref:hypothetical protein n=1 Tax=Dysgonomonas sp. 521 TaxID=2302932 RepID=UPI0013D0A03E|nr:hypothetical protein [Dysgonomonas sp. 521]NDV95018.1 hypothetical protein [Dysgonomonas sp. 521]